jgi:hypothetical protein
MKAPQDNVAALKRARLRIRPLAQRALIVHPMKTSPQGRTAVK